MSASSSGKSRVAVFLAVLVVSSATMIALFWLFPLTTAVVTLGLLALLFVSARLARAIDVTDISDIEHRGV